MQTNTGVFDFGHDSDSYDHTTSGKIKKKQTNKQKQTKKPLICFAPNPTQLSGLLTDPTACDSYMIQCTT